MPEHGQNVDSILKRDCTEARQDFLSVLLLNWRAEDDFGDASVVDMIRPRHHTNATLEVDHK